MRRSTQTRDLVLLSAFVLLSLACAVVMVVAPFPGLVAAIALGALLLLIRRPHVALLLFPFVWFFTNLPVIESIGSPEKILSLFILIGFLLHLPFRQRWRKMDASLIITFAVLVLLHLALSFASPIGIRANLVATQSFVLKAVLALLVFKVARHYRDIDWALWALSAVLVIASLSTAYLMYHFEDFYILRRSQEFTPSGFVWVWASHPVLKYATNTILGNANQVARFCVLMLPVLFFASRYTKRSMAKALYFALIGACWMLIYAGASRTGLVVGVVVMVLMAFRFRAKWLLALAAVGGLLAFSIQTSDTLIADRFSELNPNVISENTRYKLIEVALEAFGQRPFLGAGPGSNVFVTAKLSGLKSAAGHDLQVHNTYLRVLVELGIGGLVCFGALVFFYLRQLWAADRVAPAGWVKDLLGVFQIGSVSILLTGLTANVLYENKNWFYAGLALATASMVSAAAREREAAAASAARASEPPPPAPASPKPLPLAEREADGHT